MSEDPRWGVTNEDLDALDDISNPEAAGFYPTAQIGLDGKAEVFERPPCELCGLPAIVNTPRLDGNIENNPYIDLCASCDRKYHETLGDDA